MLCFCEKNTAWKIQYDLHYQHFFFMSQFSSSKKFKSCQMCMNRQMYTFYWLNKLLSFDNEKCKKCSSFYIEDYCFSIIWCVIYDNKLFKIFITPSMHSMSFLTLQESLRNLSSADEIKWHFCRVNIWQNFKVQNSRLSNLNVKLKLLPITKFNKFSKGIAMLLLCKIQTLWNIIQSVTDQKRFQSQKC